MLVKDILVSDLNMYENNPRNNDKAAKAVAESIRQFGFRVPLVIDSNNTIVCGHTRYKAALIIELQTVPCVVADDLTPEQIRAYRLADNKTGEIAEWDFELLENELEALTAFDVDMTAFGFEESLFEDIPEELDDDRNKGETAVVTIKFENVNDYEISYEELKNIAEVNNGNISVKMQ